MIYPENFEQKIGFDNIRQMLQAYCVSSLGQDYLKQLKFETDHGIITDLLDETDEFKSILESSESFPSQDYFNLIPELERIRIEGSYIQQDQLFDLKTSLSVILECKEYFNVDRELNYPVLEQIAEQIIIDPFVIEKIKMIIDDKGRIRDNASPGLNEIRKSLKAQFGAVDRRINNALKQAKKEGWTDKEVEVTIRNGRMVIPVHAAHKRNIRGFIHDESASGQTVYVEPEEVFQTNNEIRELEIAEKREIIKILESFTDFLRPFIDELIHDYLVLGRLDAIRAKARLAIRIKAIRPVLEDRTMIEWKKAMHPLLFLSHQERKKEIVPLDISLNKENRILIISGPNAGGKSVCLKTVGLVQYAIQCGLLVPMDDHSTCGIFQKIFIDIGDEQSLENDLSTYSSHLLNIRHFLENSDKKTLFLIDEFGTGTEPQLGGVIAETALEKLNKNNSFGVVTTHYANLKLLADQENGILNGAMLFDSKKMKPLYVLKIGKPGSSFAFEIARNIGLPEEILEQAKVKTGRSQLDFEQQLQQLEVEKRDIEKSKEEFKVADTFLAEMINKYEKLLSDLEISKDSILASAQEEAMELIGRSNKLIEKTIKDIKEAQANRDKTKEARHKVKAHEKEILVAKDKIRLKKKKVQQKPKDKPVIKERLEIGDMVKLLEHNSTGEILEIKKNKAKVVSGSMTLSIPLDQLAYVSREKRKQVSRSAYKGIINDINQKAANFVTTLDLRGKRAEEALSMIQRYLDDAMLVSAKEVRIVHGKGDGILRSVIRDHLKTVDEIEQFGDEHVERGGDGITIIYFR